VKGTAGNLLVDTDYAGTIQGFYRAIKGNGIRLNQISCVMATHYHPDHCGLIGWLQTQGVQLLLMESQAEAVHDPDYIFAREKREYIPVETEKAIILTANESRRCLKRLGIEGEIIRTVSHSADSVSLILDDGSCFVGDLEPREYIEAYADNAQLAEDWKLILSRNAKIIHYAHAPVRTVQRF
jgi:glyoxylase-like metal-dependent hydrolase (beta-lactamase superfamily II)